MTGLIRSQQILLDLLFDRGSIKFGEFRLKLHEEHPEAPLSPVFFDYGTLKDGGPLTAVDVAMIGREMYKLIRDRYLEFDLVAGIPRGGEPFAEVVAQLAGAPLLKFGKKIEGGQCKIHLIVDGDYSEGQTILLIDDVLSGAKTKEEAIQVCDDAGLDIQDFIVLLDRQLGGTKRLNERGRNLHAVFVLSDLLQYYLVTGEIDKAKYEEIMAYRPI